MVVRVVPVPVHDVAEHLLVVEVALRFVPYSRDDGTLNPGWTAVIAAFFLLAFAASVDRGMLPNRFPDAGDTPEYNTVDATLWFFEAVRTLAAHTQDYEFVRANLDRGATAMLEARGADAEAAIARLEELLIEFRDRKED